MKIHLEVIASLIEPLEIDLEQVDRDTYVILDGRPTVLASVDDLFELVRNRVTPDNYESALTSLAALRKLIHTLEYSNEEKSQMISQVSYLADLTLQKGEQ